MFKTKKYSINTKKKNDFDIMVLMVKILYYNQQQVPVTFICSNLLKIAVLVN